MKQYVHSFQAFRVCRLVHSCAVPVWSLPPVLLPMDADRVLPHELEKLCVATFLLLSQSSVCVCVHVNRFGLEVCVWILCCLVSPHMQISMLQKVQKQEVTLY